MRRSLSPSSRTHRGGALPWAVAVTGLVMALLVGCSSDSPERADLPDPGPTPTTEPQPDDPGAPGTLVAAQERTDEVPGRRSWAITYASTTAAGAPIGVTGQVVVPEGDPPPGGWPVLAWGHPTTGTSDRCTPSQEGSGEIHNIDQLMAAGIAVAATDYEGLGIAGGHPYMVGPTAGHNILDAVRAAGAIGGAGIGTDSPVVAAGFSQGGHAALWAAQLAPEYAPELDLVGVQAVAPVTDVVQFAARAESYDAQVGVLATIVWGFSLAYPELDVTDVLSDDGMALLYATEDRCIAEVVVAYTHPVDEIVRESPLEAEDWRKRLEESTAATVALGLPVHVLQGGDDPIVYPQVTDEAVARLCEAGDTVQYDVVPGVDHGVLTPERTMPWIQGAFAGVEPPDNCP